MELPLYQGPEDTLWRVIAADRQSIPAGKTYYYENQQRLPLGVSVVQLVTRGRIDFHHARSVTPVTPGSVFCFHYGEATAYGTRGRLESDFACQWVNLAGSGIAEHLQAIRHRFGPVIDAEGADGLTDRIARITDPRRHHRTEPLTGTAAEVHALIMALIDHAGADRLRHLTGVDRAIEWIISRPTAVDSLKSLAQRFGCSREHLARVFTQRHGQPVSGYIRRAKLRRAQAMLHMTEFTIGEVARQSGFASTHALNRAFKADVGHTAGAWRDQQTHRRLRGR